MLRRCARSVSRDDIVNGARELGLELDEHIAVCVKAMQDRADALGLKGSIQSPINRPRPGEGKSGSP
jgi:hypothetical protein